MEVKTYGLYDTVAKTLINTFTAQNDDVALRSLEQICKDPKTDVSTIKDCVLKYLYTMDSSSATIIDITQRDLVACAALIDKLPAPSVDSDSLEALKEQYQKVFNALKAMQENQKSLDEILKHYEQLEQIVKDIIGGKIKCQKYKKHKK